MNSITNLLKIITVFFLLLSFCRGSSQQLSPNECGVVFTYDAAGNRNQRIFHCNISGIEYPQGKLRPTTENSLENTEFIPVDALYPNPTTGIFYVTFNRDLKDANVYLTDVNGKIVQQFKASGNKIRFNIYGLSNGVYFMRVEHQGNVITKKVIKQ